jgi:hypothetical protein
VVSGALAISGEVCYNDRMNVKIRPAELNVPALHWVVIKLKEQEKPLFGTMEACSVDEVTDRLAAAANEADFVVLRDLMVRWDDVENITVHLVKERTW